MYISSISVFAAVTAHGVARVCGDHRLLRSVLVLAPLIHITLVLLFFFGYCFKRPDNVLLKYFTLQNVSSTLRKIRIQLHRGAGPKWQDEELALVIRTLKHVFFFTCRNLCYNVNDFNALAIKTIA
jgi:hypothetical protein